MTNLTQITQAQAHGPVAAIPADTMLDGQSPTAGSLQFSKATAAAQLAAVVFPYSGTFTWTGSGTSKAVTVPGVASTDRVVYGMRVAPTQAAYIVSAIPTANTITFTLSAANTSNDAQISYLVIRP